MFKLICKLHLRLVQDNMEILIKLIHKFDQELSFLKPIDLPIINLFSKYIFE